MEAAIQMFPLVEKNEIIKCLVLVVVFVMEFVFLTRNQAIFKYSSHKLKT